MQNLALKLKDNKPYNDIYGKTIMGSHLINGESRYSNPLFQSLNPACCHDILGVFPIATKQDILDAFQAASLSLESWQVTPELLRLNILKRFSQLLSINKSYLSQLMMRETGIIYKECLIELQIMIEFIESSQLSNHVQKSEGITVLVTDSLLPSVMMKQLILSLLSGQTIIWKPATHAPCFSQVIGQLFKKAALPQGVLNIVQGSDKTGQEIMKIVDKKHIQQVYFSGSISVAQKIEKMCRNKFIPFRREEDGKSLLIIMDNVDLNLALKEALSNCFHHSGQSRKAISNILIHKNMINRFKKRFLREVKHIKIGDPILNHKVTYGPLLSPDIEETFLTHHQLAQNEGANLLYGSGKITKEKKPPYFVGDASLGYYVWPAIWDGVTANMELFKQDISGPSISLVEIKDIEEAIALSKQKSNAYKIEVHTQNEIDIKRFKTNNVKVHVMIN